MSFRLVPKSVTLNDLERRNGIILRYFSEFGQLPGALRKSSRSLSHLLMSSCHILQFQSTPVLTFFQSRCYAKTVLKLHAHIHCLKNVPPLTYYNLGIHDLIRLRVFGRSVTEKVRNQMMLCFPTSPIQCLHCERGNTEDSALCMQHSPTAGALSTFFLLNHAPITAPEPNALITKFVESYSSMSMSRESKRFKKSSSDWLNSGI